MPPKSIQSISKQMRPLLEYAMMNNIEFDALRIAFKLQSKKPYISEEDFNTYSVFPQISSSLIQKLCKQELLFSYAEKSYTLTFLGMLFIMWTHYLLLRCIKKVKMEAIPIDDEAIAECLNSKGIIFGGRNKNLDYHKKIVNAIINDLKESHILDDEYNFNVERYSHIITQLLDRVYVSIKDKRRIPIFQGLLKALNISNADKVIEKALKPIGKATLNNIINKAITNDAKINNVAITILSDIVSIIIDKSLSIKKTSLTYDDISDAFKRIMTNLFRLTYNLARYVKSLKYFDLAEKLYFSAYKIAQTKMKATVYLNYLKAKAYREELEGRFDEALNDWKQAIELSSMIRDKRAQEAFTIRYNYLYSLYLYKKKNLHEALKVINDSLRKLSSLEKHKILDSSLIEEFKNRFYSIKLIIELEKLFRNREYHRVEELIDKLSVRVDKITSMKLKSLIQGVINEQKARILIHKQKYAYNINDIERIMKLLKKAMDNYISFGRGLRAKVVFQDYLKWKSQYYIAKGEFEKASNALRQRIKILREIEGKYSASRILIQKTQGEILRIKILYKLLNYDRLDINEIKELGKHLKELEHLGPSPHKRILTEVYTIVHNLVQVMHTGSYDLTVIENVKQYLEKLKALEVNGITFNNLISKDVRFSVYGKLLTKLSNDVERLKKVIEKMKETGGQILHILVPKYISEKYNIKAIAKKFNAFSSIIINNLPPDLVDLAKKGFEVDIFYDDGRGKIYVGEIKRGRISPSDIIKLSKKVRLIIESKRLIGDNVKECILFVVTGRDLNMQEVNNIKHKLQESIKEVKISIDILHGKELLKKLAKHEGIPEAYLREAVGT